jgi:hypothetical protein
MTVARHTHRRDRAERGPVSTEAPRTALSSRTQRPPRTASNYSRRNSVFPIARITSGHSSGSLVSHTRNHDQSVHISQRIQTRSSKSASMTRSTRTTNHTTNVMKKTEMGGLLTTMSVLTAVPSSGFSMRQSHSRTIIHGVSGTWTIRILSGNESRPTILLSDSMHSTVRAWLRSLKMRRKSGFVAC